jgi:predicted transposase/invertase (TIGR01784 family)
MLAEKVDKWIAAYKVKGKAEGRIEGRIEGMAIILERMKKAGMSVAEIAKITGMPEEEIRSLI